MKNNESLQVYEAFYKEYRKGGKPLTEENRKIVKMALEGFDVWSKRFVDMFDKEMQSNFDTSLKPNSDNSWIKSLTRENVVSVVMNKWFDCLTQSLARVDNISPYGGEFRKAGRITYRRLNEGKFVTKAAVDKINNVIMQLPTEI